MQLLCSFSSSRFFIGLFSFSVSASFLFLSFVLLLSFSQLGVAMRDLIYTNDASSSFVEGGHVSWTKMSKLAKIFQTFLSLQSLSVYNCAPDIAIQEYLCHHLYGAEEKKKYELSKQLEGTT
jgi:hypothetical protein